MSALGIIGGAAAIGSGILNGLAMNEQNDIAREQFQESMKFQRQMMYEQARLNSPEYHVQQYRRAGINPALAMYGGSTIAPVSQPSGPSPNAQVGSPDYSFMPSAAASLLSGLSQEKVNESAIRLNDTTASKNQSETLSMNIDNLFKNAHWRNTLRGQELANNLTDLQAQLAEKELYFADKSMGDRLLQQQWQAENWRATASANLIAAKYADDEHQAEISQKVAAAFMSYATGQSSLKQAHNDMLRVYAQYGADDDQRKGFWRATMNLLEQQWNESKSREFGNISSASPIPLNNGRWTQYEEWRDGKRQTTGGSMYRYKHRRQTGGVR